MLHLLVTRLFVILMILWVVIILLFTFVISTNISDSPVNNINVGHVVTSTITRNSGTTEYFYSQTFDSYGNGVPGVSLYYNVTLPLQQDKLIAGGYAGESNAGGFTVFNVSGFYGGNTYQVSEHFYNHATGYDGNNTFTIDTTNPNGYPASTHVSITPVFSSIEPGSYALHVWTPNNITYGNATLSYEKGTSILDFISASGLYNENLTVSRVTLNLSGSQNYVTPFRIHGPPYFYVAVVKDSSGSVQAITIFSTSATPSIESQLTFGGVIAGSYPLLFLVPVFTITALSSRGRSSRYPLERFIMKGTNIPDLGSRSSTFMSIIAVSTVISIPFVAASTLLIAYLTRSVFGQTASPADILIYVAATLLMVMIMASVMAIIYVSRYRWILRGKDEGEKRSRAAARLLVYISAFALFYYYYGNNFNGYFFYSAVPHTLVNLDITNPFAYMYLVLMKMDSNLYAGTIITITPSEYGLIWPVIIVLGLFWLVLWVILPYLLYRRSERKLQGPVEDGQSN